MNRPNYLTVAGLGAAFVVGYKYLAPQVMKAKARVTSGEFADKYLDAQSNNVPGIDHQGVRDFIATANRRLRKIDGDAKLGDARARDFLEALKVRGITEANYNEY